ncbi:MAG TPA: nucleotidyltransferase domain-containing protein [Solirubrobacteraceae bacterium]|nr:nucleotidyltransferase domain-containing protein [Solirubrobacteraceae bacterium]
MSAAVRLILFVCRPGRLRELVLNDEERSVLERWLELMRAELDLESVWLYGSRARGEGSAPDSDIDLLVITRGDRTRDRERAWRLIHRAADDLHANPAPFVPHARDRDWLDQRRAARSFFIEEVDRDKVVLLGQT